MRIDPSAVPMMEARPAARLEPRCPECGATLAREGGCDLCRACGYSACG